MKSDGSTCQGPGAPAHMVLPPPTRMDASSHPSFPGRAPWDRSNSEAVGRCPVGTQLPRASPAFRDQEAASALNLNGTQKREEEGRRGKTEKGLEIQPEQKTGADLKLTCNKPAMTAKQSY